jgi:hypothetical protein
VCLCESVASLLDRICLNRVDVRAITGLDAAERASLELEQMQAAIRKMCQPSGEPPSPGTLHKLIKSRDAARRRCVETYGDFLKSTTLDANAILVTSDSLFQELSALIRTEVDAGTDGDGSGNDGGLCDKDDFKGMPIRAPGNIRGAVESYRKWALAYQDDVRAAQKQTDTAAQVFQFSLRTLVHRLDLGSVSIQGPHPSERDGKWLDQIRDVVVSTRNEHALTSTLSNFWKLGLDRVHDQLVSAARGALIDLRQAIDSAKQVIAERERVSRELPGLERWMDPDERTVITIANIQRKEMDAKDAKENDRKARKVRSTFHCPRLSLSHIITCQPVEKPASRIQG